MNKILIVVDMQEGFETAKDENLIRDIRLAIKRFKKENQYILILEYFHPDIGKTFNEIKDAIKKYKKSKIKQKIVDDGSDKVIEFISENKLSYPKIYICGVNTSYCIRQTAESLCGSYLVTVFDNLCRCFSDRHEYMINEWERFGVINIEKG